MSVLYTQDGDYKTRTEAEDADVVPAVVLPAASVTANTVVRGKLGAKISKAEGPAWLQFRILIAARDWLPSHAYAVGEMVTNDTLKQYICTTAGISASSGGPTGTGSGITDSEATWQYISPAPVAFDTHEIALNEVEAVDLFLSFEFEIHLRVTRQTGTTYRQWHPTVLAYGKVVSPVVAGGIWFPTEGPSAAAVQSSENNVLHVLYTPELGSGSITARCYVLEVL